MNRAGRLSCFVGFVLCVLGQGAAWSEPGQSVTRMVCIGDSVIYGATIDDREANCFPAQLQKMLGAGWQVTNFGINSRIMQKQGDFPYWNEDSFKEAQAMEPDVVLISLGGNDTKPHNWKPDNYKKDYAAMVDVFLSLPKKPRILLCYPVPAYRVQWGINDATITDEVIPIITDIAKQKDVEIVDLHTALSGVERLFPDKIHPNAEGAGMMAQTVYKTLLGRGFDGVVLPGRVSDWNGYQKYDFEFDGRGCSLVAPKVEAAGRPWIWRARFFGHEPQTDLALLARGFHVAYIDVADLFGGPPAVGHWNAFYKYLTGTLGFSKKPVLEGMSRGGLIVMNWAKKNPDRVSCIYIDAPVCDIGSWPGGKGATTAGDPGLWKKCLDVYGLTEAQAETFADNPIDNLEALAKADVPILSVCGDADTAAILDENTRVLEARYRALGGRMEVLIKQGVGHHPHSLKDPAPIVNFILAHTTGVDG